MKKTILSLAAIACVATYVSAMDFAIEGKFGSKSYDYMERKDDGTKLDSESKSLGSLNTFGVKGIVSGHSGLLMKDNFASLEYDRTKMTTKYIGSFLGGNYGDLESRTDNVIQKYQFNYGEGTHLTSSLSTDVYIGVGYKTWDRKLSATQDEKYNYKFVAIGNDYKYEFTKDFSMGLGVEGYKAINPTMDAHSSLGDMSFDLGNTYGVIISAPIEFKISKHLTTFAEYSFDYQKITKSDVISGGYYEPDSKNYSHEVNVGIRYSF